MAIVNGTEYEFIDMQQASGGNTTRHMLRDAQARGDISSLESAIGEIRNEFNTEYTQIAAANITKTQGKRWMWDGGTELTETGASSCYAYSIEVTGGGFFDICGWSAGTTQGYCIYLFDGDMNKLDAITDAVQITVDGEPYHTRFEAPSATRYIHYTVYYNLSAGLVYDKQMIGGVGSLKDLIPVAAQVQQNKNDISALANDISALTEYAEGNQLDQIRDKFGTEYTQIAAANITKTQGKRWVWNAGTELTETGASNNYAYAVEVEHGGPIDICGWSAGTNQGFCIYLFDENMNKLDAITNAVQISVGGEPYHTRFEAPYKTRYIHYTVYYNASAGLVYDKQMQGGVGELIDLGLIAAQVQENTEAISELGGDTETVHSKNLNDASKMVQGFLSNSAGVISTEGSYANYHTTDFIEIESNQDYTISLWNADKETAEQDRMAILLYDQYKTAITSTYANTSNVHSLTKKHADAKYLRASARTTTTNHLLQVEKGSSATAYEDYYVKTYSTLYVKNDKLPYENHLYGKKWAVCGDSFTNGATSTKISGGRYDGKAYVYPYLIGNRQNMQIAKFFLGGRTLAYPEDGTFHNSLTDPNADCYYQNIPADSDYITIYLGINDGNHETGSSSDGEDTTGYISLGTITDEGTDTYYGAWNNVIPWLLENRPFAHIGIIVSNGVKSADWRTAQIAIAQKYGIPYIDLNGDQHTTAMIRSVNPDIPAAVKEIIRQKQAVDPDGTETGSVNNHPNDAAHLFESYAIEEFLRRI